MKESKVMNKGTIIDTAEMEIVPLESVPFVVKETWIDRFKAVSPEVKIGQAVKVTAADNREVSLIRASWIKVNLTRKPRSKIQRALRADKITVYLWIEKSG